MKVICISGKAGSGKSTCAEAMREHLERTTDFRVLLCNYADALKYVLKTYFHWNGQKDEAGRKLLQEKGTDEMRAYDANFWVNLLVGILSAYHKSWDVVIVADCRFKNEIDLLKSAGFSVTTVRIERPNFDNGLAREQKIHESETGLDDYAFDEVIVNDFSDSHTFCLACQRKIDHILETE